MPRVGLCPGFYGSSNIFFCKKVNLSVNNKFLYLELVSAMCLNIDTFFK